MVDLNPTISTTVLSISNLTIPVKRQRLYGWIFFKSINYSLTIQFGKSLNFMIHNLSVTGEQYLPCRDYYADKMKWYQLNA